MAPANRSRGSVRLAVSLASAALVILTTLSALVLPPGRSSGHAAAERAQEADAPGETASVAQPSPGVEGTGEVTRDPTPRLTARELARITPALACAGTTYLATDTVLAPSGATVVLDGERIVFREGTGLVAYGLEAYGTDLSVENPGSGESWEGLRVSGGTVSITGCTVEGATVGLYAEGASGSVSRTVFRGCGVGLSVDGPESTFLVADNRMRDNLQAISVYDARVRIEGNLITRSSLVVGSQGSDIGTAGNIITGNYEVVRLDSSSLVSCQDAERGNVYLTQGGIEGGSRMRVFWSPSGTPSEGTAARSARGARAYYSPYYYSFRAPTIADHEVYGIHNGFRRWGDVEGDGLPDIAYNDIIFHRAKWNDNYYTKYYLPGNNITLRASILDPYTGNSVYQKEYRLENLHCGADPVTHQLLPLEVSVMYVDGYDGRAIGIDLMDYFGYRIKVNTTCEEPYTFMPPHMAPGDAGTVYEIPPITISDYDNPIVQLVTVTDTDGGAVQNGDTLRISGYLTEYNPQYSYFWLSLYRNGVVVKTPDCENITARDASGLELRNWTYGHPNMLEVIERNVQIPFVDAYGQQIIRKGDKIVVVMFHVDKAGNVGSDWGIATVENNPPKLDPLPTLYIPEGNTIPHDISRYANDLDPFDTLEFRFWNEGTRTSQLKPGGIGNPITISPDGIIRWTPTNEQAIPSGRVYHFNVTVTDGTDEAMQPIRIIVNNTPSKPFAPVCLSPKGEIKTSTPTFHWTEPTDPDPGDCVVGYELEWTSVPIAGVDGSFSLVEGRVAGLVDTKYDLQEPLENHKVYYWHVRSVDGSGLMSPWSNARDTNGDGVVDPINDLPPTTPLLETAFEISVIPDLAVVNILPKMILRGRDPPNPLPPGPMRDRWKDSWPWITVYATIWNQGTQSCAEVMGSSLRFEMGIEMIQDLGAGPVTPRLLTEFANKGTPLSPSAVVYAVPGGTWYVKDGSTVYTIWQQRARNGTQTLEVHDSPLIVYIYVEGVHLETSPSGYPGIWRIPPLDKGQSTTVFAFVPTADFYNGMRYDRQLMISVEVDTKSNDIPELDDYGNNKLTINVSLVDRIVVEAPSFGPGWSELAGGLAALGAAVAVARGAPLLRATTGGRARSTKGPCGRCARAGVRGSRSGPLGR